MSDLYREEATDAARNRLSGNVVLRLPVSFLWGVVFFATALLCVGVFLFFGEYSRTVRATGIIVPAKGISRISAPAGAFVEQILVQENEEVREGEILGWVRLATDEAYGDEAQINVRKSLDREISSYVRQRSEIRDELKLTRQQFDISIQVLKKEALALQEAIRFQKEILEVSEATLKRIDEVHNRGFISTVRREEAWQLVLGQRAQVVQLESDLVVKELKRDELTTKRQAAEHVYSVRDEQLVSQLEAAKREKSYIEVGQRRALIAPREGRVGYVGISVGEVIKDDSAAFMVLDRTESLVAEMYLPSTAIGFVKVGQKARLAYDAFPYTIYGFQEAVIASISQTVILPHDAILPPEINEPVYRVQLSLKDEVMHSNGISLQLKLGMAFEARVELEKVTFFESLLGPLRSITS